MNDVSAFRQLHSDISGFSGVFQALKCERGRQPVTVIALLLATLGQIGPLIMLVSQFSARRRNLLSAFVFASLADAAFEKITRAG